MQCMRTSASLALPGEHRRLHLSVLVLILPTSAKSFVIHTAQHSAAQIPEPLPPCRKAPLSLLDWPDYSDGAGNPVVLARRPPDHLAAWQPVVDSATDADGWQFCLVAPEREAAGLPGGVAAMEE